MTVSQRLDRTATQRPTISYSHCARTPQPPVSPPTSAPLDVELNQRNKARKPSPGLTARFQALGFGKTSSRIATQSKLNDRIGRIPESKLNNLDKIHITNLDMSSATREQDINIFNTRSMQRKSDITNEELIKYNSIVLEAPKNNSALSAMATKEDHRSGDTKVKIVNRSDNVAKDSENDNSSNQAYTESSKMSHPSPVNDPSSEITWPTQLVLQPSAHFNPIGLQRSGSIYTLSRVSFASQLAQLTSLQLPDAESLSAKLLAIPTSKIASKILIRASEQIRGWITKAAEVVAGLDGEDDVEWAAAGGREGLEDVDNAIIRFEELINIFGNALDTLKARDDILNITVEELNVVIEQVQFTFAEWFNIKKMMKDVKTSVEIAMEWEELWNTVLGDIGAEMNVLMIIVFEMEEKRHRSTFVANPDGLGLEELETIMEESSQSKKNKHKVGTNLSSMSLNSPIQAKMPDFDDSNLLALFARMQPLRASLDFFPMRLSTFLPRAEKIFPTACGELKSKLKELEGCWKNLERDAESLRKELGEDRWVLVFKAAGQQAQRMYESVRRSVIKITEAVDGGAHLENSASVVKHYEKKKQHYGPAIEQVLSIINEGVKKRLTVNGEILRLHWEMQRKWDVLKDQMDVLDAELSDFNTQNKKRPLSNSISSMISNDCSIVGSLHETPRSSPGSSIITTSHRENTNSLINVSHPPNNRNKFSSSSGKRTSSLPIGPTRLPRKGITSRLSTVGPSPVSSPSRQGNVTPVGHRSNKASPIQTSDAKPRWNSSTKVSEGPTSQNFKQLTPISHITPKSNITCSSRSTGDFKMATSSPLSSSNDCFLAPNSTPSRNSKSRLASRERFENSGRYSKQTPVSTVRPPVTQNQLHNQHSISSFNVSHRDSLFSRANRLASEYTPTRPNRSVSSLAAHRRVSLIPLPKRNLAT
ncbi:/kar9 containing protein [Blumeria hordei DH14]|uniref:/kar9 containing protein n=1 Tax=Blumeria graminis f. sp. hordei (strain DH14) TaxID=546991 RepID=N1JJ72_BLUG1|nr:/kar9 containing protein [Blumeria hordei DH14]